VKRRLIRIGLFAAALFAAGLILPHHAFANYDQNNLIDDPIFLNVGTMNQASIQSFLNGKGGALAHYTDPLVNQGAAQIIYTAAQEYGVNPQVILATLQKEESLITDPSPDASQYRSAMGYGCPDSSVCDQKYYGLYNQVENGTWQLRFNFERAGGNNSWWNPNISYDTRYMVGKSLNFGDCSGITVYFSNRGTASLYRYTPHAYYSAPGCYYSGSINFVNSFESWFGPIHGNVTSSYTAQPSNSGTIYLLDPGTNKKYAFPDPGTFLAYGFRWGGTPVVDPASLSGYTDGGVATKFAGVSGSTYYLVDSGMKHGFSSYDMFTDWGATDGQLTPLSDTLLNILIDSSNVTNLARTPDGSVYNVVGGQKRPIASVDAFNALGYSWANVVNYSSNALASLPLGPLMLQPYAKIMVSGDATVYMIDGTSKWPVSGDAFSAWGMNWSQVYHVDQATGQSYTTNQTALPIMISDGSGNNYVVVGGQKRPVPASWGVSSSIFTTVSSGLLSALPTGGTMTQLIRTSDGSVYYVTGGKKKPIANPTIFSQAGFSWGQEVNVVSSVAASITTGGLLLPDGLIINPAGSYAYYLMDQGKKVLIPDPNIFNAWGFSWNAFRPDQSSADAYTASANPLSYFATDITSSNVFIMDGGRKWFFPDGATFDGYGMNWATMSRVSRGIIDGRPTAGVLTRFVQGSNYTVYYMKNGQRQPIPSPNVLFSLGGNWNKITRLSDIIVNSFQTGPTASTP
jgi:hypothetical protein